ncbi:MAG: hypothetical protein J0L75_03180 [Spirochaetes bacterium]|nr:hypothetical protein [Spirochaetota bacterium]
MDSVPAFAVPSSPPAPAVKNLGVKAALAKVLQRNRIAAEAIGLTIADLEKEVAAIGTTIENDAELVHSLDGVMKSLNAFKDLFLEQEAGYKQGIQRLQASSKKLGQITTMTGWLTKQLPELRRLFVLMDEKLKALHNLSFNISIEAARAGEKGAGFKVITIEVRKLKDAIADILPKVKVFIEETLHQGLGTTATKIGEVNLDLQTNVEGFAGMQRQSLEQIQEISLLTESLELTVRALAELREQQKAIQLNLLKRIDELTATRGLLILEIAVDESAAPDEVPQAKAPPTTAPPITPPPAEAAPPPAPQSVTEAAEPAAFEHVPAAHSAASIDSIRESQGFHVLEAGGRTYVLINYLHFPEDDALLERGCLDLIAQARAYYERLPERKKVYAISNFTGTKAVKDVPKRLAQLAEVAMKHQEKSAVVGVRGAQYLYLATINKLHGGKSRFRVPFDTIEKAWAWIQQ